MIDKMLVSSLRTISAFVVALSLLFIAVSALSQTTNSNLSELVDRLVLAYNNQNASAYRESFSPELKKRFSVEALQDVLRSNMTKNGRIVSHNTLVSPDGSRALVLLEMEKGAFDVHLRINDNNKLMRLEWFPHKEDTLESALVTSDQHKIQERYQPYVDEFIQALKDTNAEEMLSLMVKDEDDDWSIDDYKSFLTQMNSRGLKDVGSLEIMGPNEVLVPVHFESSELGFYLSFSEDNKITNLRIENYAPSESHEMTYTALGSDTLQTTVLTSFDQLRDKFGADSGKVRFIALLSPT